MPGFDQSGALAAANSRDDIKQRRKDRNLARNQAIAQLIIQGVQAVANIATGGVGAYQGGVRNDLLQKRVEGEQELGLKSLDLKAASEERAGNEFGLTQEARRQEREDDLGFSRDELTSRESLAGLAREASRQQHEETMGFNRDKLASEESIADLTREGADRRAAVELLLNATAKDGGGISPEMRAVAEAYGLPVPAAAPPPPPPPPEIQAPEGLLLRGFRSGSRSVREGLGSIGQQISSVAGDARRNLFGSPDAAPAPPPAPSTPNVPSQQLERFFRPTPGGLGPREGGFSPLRLRPEPQIPFAPPTNSSLTPRAPPAGWTPPQETSGLSSPALRSMVLQQMLAEESSSSIPGIAGPPEEEKKIDYPDNAGAKARRRRAFQALSRG